MQVILHIQYVPLLFPMPLLIVFTIYWTYQKRWVAVMWFSSFIGLRGEITNYIVASDHSNGVFCYAGATMKVVILYSQPEIYIDWWSESGIALTRWSNLFTKYIRKTFEINIEMNFYSGCATYLIHLFHSKKVLRKVTWYCYWPLAIFMHMNTLINTGLWKHRQKWLPLQLQSFIAVYDARFCVSEISLTQI